MKELYIIRHGPAGKSLEDLELDEMRPLTKKGRQKMKDVAKSLNKMGVTFDKIVSSPLARCLETARMMEKCCKDDHPIETVDCLRPDGSIDDVIGFLNALDGIGSVAIVGHEPFLSEFASYCLAKSKSSFIDLKKGGVIALDVDGMVKPGACRMCWMLDPAEI